jgi:hypothetical protein
MDATALLALIDADAATEPYRPGGAKSATGDGGKSAFACIADLLNRRDRPGYVPARWVSVTLAEFPQVDGLIRWTQTLGTLPAEMGGGPCSFVLYCMLRNLERLSQSVDKGDLRASVAKITLSLATANAKGLVGDDKMIPAGFGPYLLAGEIKISRVQEAEGLDAPAVSESDVAACYAGGE